MKNIPKRYTKKQKILFEEFVKAFLRQDLENDNLFESVCQPNLFVLDNTEENKEVLDYLSISYEEDEYSFYTQNFDENCKFVREVVNRLLWINEYPILKRFTGFVYLNTSKPAEKRFVLELN